MSGRRLTPPPPHGKCQARKSSFVLPSEAMGEYEEILEQAGGRGRQEFLKRKISAKNVTPGIRLKLPKEYSTYAISNTCEIHSRVLRRNEELIRRKLSLELPQRTSIKQERKQSLCYEYVPGIQQNLVERQKDKKSERSLTYELSPFYQEKERQTWVKK